MNQNMQNQMSEFNKLNSNLQKNDQLTSQLKNLLLETQNKLSESQDQAKLASRKINQLMNEIENLKKVNTQKGGKKKQKLPFKLQSVKNELYKKVEKYNIKI